MTISELNIKGAYLIQNTSFEDSRGVFEVFWEANDKINFVPDSAHHSHNPFIHTLRGMHYQEAPFGQAKLVSCVQGSVLDVIVDLRPTSASYLKWSKVQLKKASGMSVYIPKGCAHGFLTLEPHSTLSYLIEGIFSPEASRVLRWNDPSIGIDWPAGDFLISNKDTYAPDYLK